MSSGCGRARRFRGGGARRLFRPSRPAPNAPISAMSDTDRALYAILFHRKSCTRTTASRSSAISPSASAAASVTGRWRRLWKRRRRASASRSATAASSVRLSGGVDSTGRGADHSSRDRRQADVHLRRQRRPAARRSRADPQAVRAAPASAGVRRRLDAVPRSAGRRHRSRSEAQGDWRDVHRRLRHGGRQARSGGTSWRRARCTPT